MLVCNLSCLFIYLFFACRFETVLCLSFFKVPKPLTLSWSCDGTRLASGAEKSVSVATLDSSHHLVSVVISSLIMTSFDFATLFEFSVEMGCFLFSLPILTFSFLNREVTAIEKSEGAGNVLTLSIRSCF